MDENLQNYLEYFKKYTIEMISNLNNDEIGEFETALEKRSQLIEMINGLNCDGNEFKRICKDLEIVSLNNELSKILGDKREEIKGKILQLKKTQNANSAYQSILSQSNIFSKKV